MTWYGHGTVESATSGTTIYLARPDSGGAPYDGIRSVLAIFSSPTTSVTSILDSTGGPGGWTARDTYTAQGRKISLFDKTCDATEPAAYNITFTPAATAAQAVYVFLANFATSGAPIRTASFADDAAATTLVLPSLTAAGADDIWAAAESQGGGQIHPQSPLIAEGISSGFRNLEEGRQTWQSSAPTGTRTYASTSGGNYTGALGVMVLIGDYTPPSRWGVGQVRMGAN